MKNTLWRAEASPSQAAPGFGKRLYGPQSLLQLPPSAPKGSIVGLGFRLRWERQGLTYSGKASWLSMPHRIPSEGSDPSVLSEDADASVLSECSDPSILSEGSDPSILSEGADPSVPPVLSDRAAVVSLVQSLLAKFSRISGGRGQAGLSTRVLGNNGSWLVAG